MKTSLNVSLWKEGEEYVLKAPTRQYYVEDGAEGVVVPLGLLLSDRPYFDAVEAVNALEAAKDGLDPFLSPSASSGRVLEEIARIKAQRTGYVYLSTEFKATTSVSFMYEFCSSLEVAQDAAKILNDIKALAARFHYGEAPGFLWAVGKAVGR